MAATNVLSGEYLYQHCEFDSKIDTMWTAFTLVSPGANLLRERRIDVDDFFLFYGATCSVRHSNALYCHLISYTTSS